MTLDTFSSLLKEFIIAQDTVAVAGLGKFIVGMQPATISDNGFTINPPYRRLEFVCGESEDVSDAQDFEALYASKCEISREQAAQEVKSLVEEVDSLIKKESVVELVGLGRLRTLIGGGVFFIMDRDAQIFPEGFGLESVSLKNRPAINLQPEDIPHPAPAVKPEPVESIEQPVAQPTPVESAQPVSEPGKKAKKRLPVGWKIVIWLLVIAALAVVAFVVLMNFFPDVLDRLLYSPQELEIIRNQGI